jgi:inosose dehydratase
VPIRRRASPSLRPRGRARSRRVAAEHGVTHVTHPHWGTLVEQREDVLRVLQGSDVLLYLDTGHLVLGGTDPYG